MTSLTLFSPSGVVAEAATVRLAARRLSALGFTVRRDEAALARHRLHLPHASGNPADRTGKLPDLRHGT